MGTEAVFFFSSLTLFASGLLSVVSAVLFRRRLRELSRVVGNPSASVFDHTFNIFDPFPQSRTVIDSLIMIIPFIGLIGVCLAFFVIVEILVNGLLLSAVLAVISLNLLLVDGASEVYHNATVFLNTPKDRGFGEGDLKVFRIMKNALSWLSNYYFGLAVAFIILGLVLPTFMSLFLTSFAWLTEGLLIAGSARSGFSVFATPLLWSVVVGVLTLLIRAMKNRFFRSVLTDAT
jgi:hypothetical protein